MPGLRRPGLDSAFHGIPTGRRHQGGRSVFPALILPADALVLLVGVAASGKSTFADRHFAPTEILSSDSLRAIIADDAVRAGRDR